MQDPTQEILDQIIDTGLKKIGENPNFSKDAFNKIKNDVYKDYDVAKPFSSTRILERYNARVAEGSASDDEYFRRLVRKRGVRSLSGVTVISLLTKFWGCPGKCVYCPTFPGLPKSYIPHEPAVMRAQLNKFDAILQIHNRLRALEVTGHKIEKNDVRIIGGTWSFYPKDYQEQFIKDIYDAFNSYDDMKEYIEETDLSQDRFASFKIREGFKVYASKDIAEAKKRNESSRCRVIGIAIETRPDWITPEEIVRLRSYGVTRIEIGYQTTNDEINELNKRGHGNKESQNATQMLKDAGFKVVAHMMPNLLGSTPELDKISMQECFENPLFRPDELKIYPMVVTDMAELTDIWKEGGFEAYDDETLIELMCDLETYIPEYVRINRTYRDIPATEILHGSTLSNLRQIVEERLLKRGIVLQDIRSREIKDKHNDPSAAVLRIMSYEASGGKEYFLTFEDPQDRTIFSLLRLRIPTSIYHPDSEQIYEMKTEASKKITSSLTPLLRGDGKLDSSIVYEREGNVVENYYTTPEYIKGLLKELRQKQTSTEKILWEILRAKKFLGLKFRRQHPFGRYIADFYCDNLKLVIELDGKIHDNQKEYDSIRDSIIKQYGVKILRYTNEDILNNLEKVLAEIQAFSIPSPGRRGSERGYQIPDYLPELAGAALIREIHTFGDQLSIGQAGREFGQHIGFGKRLIAEAEKIAQEQHSAQKIAVIAGVGVRGYYEKRGYILEGEYMTKTLS